MQAGKLDRIIVVQRAVISYNDFNEPIESWSELSRLAARYRPKTGHEKWQAARETTVQEARFYTRYTSDIKTVDRILFEHKIWDITNIFSFGKRGRQGLEILAQVVE